MNISNLWNEVSRRVPHLGVDLSAETAENVFEFVENARPEIVQLKAHNLGQFSSLIEKTRIVVHLPNPIFSENGKMINVDEILELVERADGAEMFVLHAVEASEDYSRINDACKGLLNFENLRKKEGKLVEIRFPDQIVDFNSQYNAGYVFDVGHAMADTEVQERYSLEDWFRILGNDLRLFHVHGISDAPVKTHRSLQGNIDWRKFFNLRAEFCPKVPIILELKNLKRLEKSLLYLKKELPF